MNKDKRREVFQLVCLITIDVCSLLLLWYFQSTLFSFGFLAGTFFMFARFVYADRWKKKKIKEGEDIK